MKINTGSLRNLIKSKAVGSRNYSEREIRHFEDRRREFDDFMEQEGVTKYATYSRDVMEFTDMDELLLMSEDIVNDYGEALGTNVFRPITFEDRETINLITMRHRADHPRIQARMRRNGMVNDEAHIGRNIYDSLDDNLTYLQVYNGVQDNPYEEGVLEHVEIVDSFETDYTLSRSNQLSLLGMWETMSELLDMGESVYHN